MPIRLQFFGAAQSVTGSRTLIETGSARVLVDCGLYQERHLKERNWDPLPVPAKSIDAVLLTHAHLDHCGWLPKLAADGFAGTVYCTSASGEIAEIVLLDSAHMQEEDVKWKMKRHQKSGQKSPYPYKPLYDTDQAKAVIRQFAPVDYENVTPIAPGVQALFRDAGHILGSAMIHVTVKDGDTERTLLFSGDVGRANRPILRNPGNFAHADYVVIESTYGDRIHPPEDDVQTLLADAINKTAEKGGNVLIPAFSVERSQDLLYHLHALRRDERIPPLMTFLDSPMAVNVTQVFRRHAEMYDKEMAALVRAGQSPFDMPGLKLVRTVETSKSINHIRGTAIVIAGSGMCTGGRIKHHLVNNIHRPESLILFVGYQAHGTLGRLLVDGKREVRIFGREHEVRAGIKQIHGFSGHADRDELTEWIGTLEEPPRKVFVIHGDDRASASMAKHLADAKGWDTHAPALDEVAELA